MGEYLVFGECIAGISSENSTPGPTERRPTVCSASLELKKYGQDPRMARPQRASLPAFPTENPRKHITLPHPVLYLGNRLPPAAPFFPAAPGPPAPFALPPALPFRAPASGPLAMSSAKPKSRQAGSRRSAVALWMPKAACWSGTTSSSSSGLTGWWCAGT